MADIVHQINPAAMLAGRAAPAASIAPSRVERVADAALHQKGISSVVEHHDPGFFKTKIFTLFPPLAELHEAHAFPFPDLDSLLEAHLRKRWEAEWDTFKPEKQLKYKRALAGSARNWDDLIYQVVLENLDQFQGLTQDQRERLQRSPLIREEFSHNSPLNGQSYLSADGTRVDLTHAGSCSEDRASEGIHLFRRISYNENGETLYYTGRPETLAKAIEQAESMFRHEQGPRGKGITPNPDGSVTFTYLVNSMVDSGFWGNLDGEDVKEFLRQETVTLRALRGRAITIDGRQVRLNPILIHEQYNIGATAEECTPAWFSGKKSSDKILSENLPLLETYALQVKHDLQRRYPTASLKEQPEILKKIRYIDLALQRLGNYDALPPDERVFYFALLSRMLNIPFVIHCKSSKDRTGSAGKLVAALYTWLDAGMPDDFSRIIGKKSSKDDHLRKLFDELVTGHLMAAHQVSGYGIGADGVVEGEQLEPDRMGLDIGGAPPTVDHLPERYTKATPLLFCAKAFLFFLGAVILEVFGITAALLEITFTPILFIFWIFKYHDDSEKFWDHFLYITRNIFSTLHKDIFRIFCSCVATPTRGIDKKSPYVQAHTLLKPKSSIQMTEEAQGLLRSIDELPQETHDEMLVYLRSPAPELADDTPHRETLVDLGRAMPLLSRVARRPDFTVSAKARTLIEAFEASEKTEWDELEYLPEHEFRHLQTFMLDDQRGKNEILSPRAQIVYKYLTNNEAPLRREEPTEREMTLFQTLAHSSCSNYFLRRVNFIEETAYNHIVAYLQDDDGVLSTLTPDEQKVLLILSEHIVTFRTTAAGREDLSVKETTLLQLLTDDKIAEILLEKIDLLPAEEYEKMAAFLQNENSEEASISDRVLKLLFQHLGLVFSNADELSERQQTILGSQASFSLRHHPFSIDHITHLNEAQCGRLLAHFQSPNPDPAALSLKDQKLLKYIVLSSEKLFEQAQRFALSPRQLIFLAALALAPYGKFTLARLNFLPDGPLDNLPLLAKQVFVRDFYAMSYETRLIRPNEKQQSFLDQGDPYIPTFVGTLIDSLAEAESQQLLQALAQPAPDASQFTVAQKRLLILLANHGDMIALNTPRRQAIVQACRNSHLFLFQVQRLAARDSVRASAAKYSTADTLADWAYTGTQDHQVESLDGETTFVVGGQFHKDINRNRGIQFVVGNDPIPNAVDDPFTLSEAFLETPEGGLFLQRLQEGLNALHIGELYTPLVAAFSQMPLQDLIELLQKQNFAQALQGRGLDDLAEPLTAAYAQISPSALKQLLKNLQDRLFVDLLFNGLKILAPLADMEQLPPLLQDCISQSGRNYGVGQLLQRHLVTGMSQFPSALQTTPGSLWRISFDAVDADTLAVDFATDFNLLSVAVDRSLGKILVNYKQHCTKTADSPLWKSRLEVPQELMLVFSPSLEDDRDLLFTAFTSPPPDALVPNPVLVGHLKDCLSGANRRIPTLPADLSAYFGQRMAANLALLQPLIPDAEYQAYVAELAQKRAVLAPAVV